MPTPAILLIIAALLPLASFVTLVFVGKRMGRPLAGWVATAAVFGSFICSLVAMILWVGAGGYKYQPAHVGRVLEWGMGQNPIDLAVRWVPHLDVGIYIDSLTVVMSVMITLVATLVHLFSAGYMAAEERNPRFFTYLGLFTFAMLGLVLAETMLQLFVFWELVGFCSYLLIGFWFEKRSASRAAVKAFVMNRIGDVGFLVGLGMVVCYVGNAGWPEVWRGLGAAVVPVPSLAQAAGTPAPRTTGVSPVPPTAVASEDTGRTWPRQKTLTFIGIALFIGAMGKSAQFPLHTWLPDAMEGPIPASALIHAATMVAAGVYLVGRIWPILTPDAKLFIAVIGCITLSIGALAAVAQTDIKKVLAYSTVSQLGYMMLAMGVGSWAGGLFHLITHGFFKALLFLGAGSVIHAAAGEQRLAQFGGLMRKIPATAIAFGIGVLAIAGIPFLSGYYSKELILTNLQFAIYDLQLGRTARGLLLWCPLAAALLTAFYMTRCWMLTFWGAPRNVTIYEEAHERPTLYGPLVMLAGLSVVAGYQWMNVRWMIESSVGEDKAYVTAIDAQTPASAAGAQSAAGSLTGGSLGEPISASTVTNFPQWPTVRNETETGAAAESRPGGFAGAAMNWAQSLGILAGVLIYLRGYRVAAACMKIAPINWFRWWLRRGMLFDDLYDVVMVNGTHGFSKFCAAVDAVVVDGAANTVARAARKTARLAWLSEKFVIDAAADGSAALAQAVGSVVRSPQTGRIRVYVLGLIAVFVAAAVAAVMATR